MNAPKLAVPSVSESVAGTVPPTEASELLGYASMVCVPPATSSRYDVVPGGGGADELAVEPHGGAAAGGRHPDRPDVPAGADSCALKCPVSAFHDASSGPWVVVSRPRAKLQVRRMRDEAPGRAARRGRRQPEHVLVSAGVGPVAHPCDMLV